ncbi:MAG TPA: beta-ketoacyl-[acyl-carrier-protein] synthase II [Acholeplasmataceae bacterium]|nr:beta-ketoacyl-[acyl-carrier-protein] synthase II [Acholeplasmataceae bacterium]
MKRRVVITGLGLVSPIGNDVNTSFQSAIQGKNGIDKITLFDTETWKVKIGGEVKNLNFEDHLDKKSIKRQDRAINLALVAAKEAYEQSGLNAENVGDPFRFGTFVSSGIGGLTTINKETEVSVLRGLDRMSPFFIPAAIINLIGGAISMQYQAKGPNLPVVTACSAATNSIGEAFRYIRDGYLDIAFAGGSEAPINPIGVNGFANMRALNQTDDINNASIPFDKRREGFVIAEGAGVLILEEYERAVARQANILGEIVGYGSTSDAYHITAPDENAEGVARALELALSDAGIKKEAIDYINAHGTSTPLNDKFETLGIKKVFKNHAYKLNVSSTKSMTGHALGASGAIESVFTVEALRNGIIPPTINYKEVDEDCDLNYTPNQAVKKEIQYAINMNLGFGGQNAILIFKKV